MSRVSFQQEVEAVMLNSLGLADDVGKTPMLENTQRKLKDDWWPNRHPYFVVIGSWSDLNQTKSSYKSHTRSYRMVTAKEHSECFFSPSVPGVHTHCCTYDGEGHSQNHKPSPRVFQTWVPTFSRLGWLMVDYYIYSIYIYNHFPIGALLRLLGLQPRSQARSPRPSWKRWHVRDVTCA